MDLYPTLLDLCGLPANTMKNEQVPLDGFSMKPFLKIRKMESGNGPELCHHHFTNGLNTMILLIRIILLDLKIGDMFAMRMERKNSITQQKMTTNGIIWLRIQNLKKKLSGFREQLLSNHSKSIPEKPKSNEYWKDLYFKKNSSADTNADGTLSWAELTAHKKMTEEEKKVLQNEHWKNSYLKKNPIADTNKDGKLSWPEFHEHKKQKN